MFKHRIGVCAASVAAVGLLSGCVAHVRSEPAYAEAVYVPPDIETYPHTNYDGRVVYLVNDRWYYREGPRWVYYRSEPRPLYTHRRRVYVHHEYVNHDRVNGGYYAAPPVNRAPPAYGPQYAPPATRVR
jgi:hypothetical protein